MGDRSAIEWTDATWNPVRGCSRVSEGCRNCYAERQAIRVPSYRLNALVTSTPSGPRWTGRVALTAGHMRTPLTWRRPRRIFVNSMSDLFADHHLDELFGVMAKAHWHQFQVLTKRPERMLDYLTGHAGGGRYIWTAAQGMDFPRWAITGHEPPSGWPLPNVWLGVSVEDQATADERIPLLLKTPAAVRWVSYEPALEAVDFKPWLACDYGGTRMCGGPYLDWLVVGGESGPGSRPFDLAWSRQTIAQGRAAGVPVFVKQLGAHPVVKDFGAHPLASVHFRDRKGGNPAEWPEDLRVREYPACAIRAS